MADGVNYSLKGFDQYQIILGDELRGERATAGKSILDVERDLKIKASYIAAIEDCDLQVFSNTGFIAGYVRSYARYLGLDPNRVFERFCSEAGFTSSNAVLSLKTAKPGRLTTKYFGPDSNWRPGTIGQSEIKNTSILDFVSSCTPVLLVLIVLFGTSFGAVSLLKKIQKLDVVASEKIPEMFTDIPKEIVNISVLELDADIYSSEELALPVFEPRDRAVSTLKANRLTALKDKKGLEFFTYSAAKSGWPVLGTLESFETRDSSDFKSQGPVLRTVPNIPELQLLAMTPAWVRIKNQAGDVVFEKILKQRETYTITKDIFKGVLRAGNAQNVYFLLNKKVFGPLSSDKSVVKNVSLDPKTIQSNFIFSLLVTESVRSQSEKKVFVNTAGVVD
jgi:cytoskeleton protein RodZ